MYNSNFESHLKDSTQIEFMNSFAKIFKEYIVVQYPSNPTSISLDQIQKVNLIKKRIFKLNQLLFFCSIFLSSLISLLKMPKHLFIMSIVFCLITLIVSFSIKQVQYRIMIVSNKECFDFKIKRHSKNEAKIFVKIVGKKLKNRVITS
ncbi:hypothetical protein OX284_013645 [Flavobacterium sp. SUN046]|uniref:hypothetical protein n=1 Tax=Flavobacterium sp. SUN046 TaxID=3002440 RepID=UPI002DBFB181|nr:hypothetical protein [Flavobacterium sp. SUN046]MEC4050481.1 hypothetical protein [Flavobacterium sp. SUN046]